MALRSRKALNEAPTPASVAPPAPVAAPTKQRAYVPPSRANRHQVVCFVDRQTKRQLDGMAYEQERTLQSLTLEALDLLFQAHGKPRIAVEGATIQEAAE